MELQDTKRSETTKQFWVNSQLTGNDFFLYEPEAYERFLFLLFYHFDIYGTYIPIVESCIKTPLSLGQIIEIFDCLLQNDWVLEGTLEDFLTRVNPFVVRGLQSGLIALILIETHKANIASGLPALLREY